jgi:hypothetical protein
MEADRRPPPSYGDHRLSLPIELSHFRFEQPPAYSPTPQRRVLRKRRSTPDLCVFPVNDPIRNLPASPCPPCPHCYIKCLRFSLKSLVIHQKKPFSAVTVQIEHLTNEGFEENDLAGIPDLVEVIRIQDTGPAEAARAIRKKL